MRIKTQTLVLIGVGLAIMGAMTWFILKSPHKQVDKDMDIHDDYMEDESVYSHQETDDDEDIFESE